MVWGCTTGVQDENRDLKIAVIWDFLSIFGKSLDSCFVPGCFIRCFNITRLKRRASEGVTIFMMWNFAQMSSQREGQYLVIKTNGCLKKTIYFFVGRMRSTNCFKHPVYLFICVCAYLIKKWPIHRHVCFTGAVMGNLAKDLLGVKMCSFLPKHNRNLSNEFRCFVNYPSRLLSSWGAEASAGRRRPHRHFPADRSTQVLWYC